MAELSAWLRRGCPLLLLTCLFAPFLGQAGGGLAARAPYVGKAPRGGPAWVRASGAPRWGRYGGVGGRQALRREARRRRGGQGRVSWELGAVLNPGVRVNLLAAGDRGRLYRSSGVCRAAAASLGRSGPPSAARLRRAAGSGGSAGTGRARFVWKSEAGLCAWGETPPGLRRPRIALRFPRHQLLPR